MFYRKYTITEELGKELEFKVYPHQEDKLTVDNDELAITLESRRLLNGLVADANQFMDGNTICKVEIEEVKK